MPNPTDFYYAIFGPPKHLRGVRLVPAVVKAEDWHKVSHEYLSKACLGQALIYEARDLWTNDLLAQLQPEYVGQWLLEQGLRWRPGSSHIYDFVEPPGMAERVSGLGKCTTARLGSWLDALSKIKTKLLERAMLLARRERSTEG